jgi:SAM-dependent methyltransferase
METGTNPFLAEEHAKRYEDWYVGPGKPAGELEKALLARLLDSFPQVRTMLEVGCGTGYFTRWLASEGFNAVGLDASLPMLSEARRRRTRRCVQGEAAALPFRDRGFDVVALITCLEFLTDPGAALAEAARVARYGLLLGVLNRWSLLALRYRQSGREVWRSARFFSPFQLERLIRKSAGNRLATVRWRTTLWPFGIPCALALPLGGFIGMAVHFDEVAAELEMVSATCHRKYLRR